jgi:hypothetical protein
VIFAAAVTQAACADADATAYLVNVTIRPGYNFPNADAALAYGNDICETVVEGRVPSHYLHDRRGRSGRRRHQHDGSCPLKM